MEFPLAKLAALEEKISSTRWVVPVLPDQELEVLLNAAIEFALEGQDEASPPCARFYREGLTFSFVKLLTDDAVSSWKPNIQQCIRANCERLICLCVLKLDNPDLLNLLAILFNPNNKFHSFNAGKRNESDLDEFPFSRPPDHRNPRGWLVDLINWFGYLKGFEKLNERFFAVAGVRPSPSPPEEDATLRAEAADGEGKAEDGSENSGRPAGESAPATELSKLTISAKSEASDEAESSVGGETTTLSAPIDEDAGVTVAAAWRLIRPFGLCHEFLTPETINRYIMPMLESVPGLLERLSDDELKKECKATESKLDTVSCLIWACKCLASRASNGGNLNRDLEMFRLKMILRLLQMPSFNSKMSALNEVNQIIGSVSQQFKPDWLTASAITNWIRDNNVLEIVLRDSLHQPQYVERLEKMLRFMIREGALTTADLDAVWGAQHGKHEAIVKNVHDLLAKLAWDFTPDQLDHLFDCFKASWSTSSKKQSDKLLEVIRRLAEDDKAGVMAHKVLVLFWNLAHSPEVCTEIMDLALANHVKILDYSCTQDRDAQKTLWLDKCVEELKTCENWVLPALKQIREICCLYDSGVPFSLPSGTSGPRLPATLSRQAVIERLQSHHSLVILVTNSLTSYMERTRKIYQEQPNLDWDTWLPDGRYVHSAQVQERLAFLRFLLKDGQLWLCAEQAKQIWICLAENAVAPDDREACFKWFSKLMGEEPDLDPGINHQFFRQNILTLDPQLLTYSGIKCFERFFKAVNGKEGHLKIRRKGIQIEEPNLIGLDYLWRVVCECSEEIALRGVELMREVCASPGARLAASSHHSAFTEDCCEKLKVAYNELCSASSPQLAAVCCVRLCRVLRVLTEYVEECDKRFTAERFILPLYRAGRGQHICLIVRFQPGQRQLDDMEVFTHSNEILQVLRNNIHKRLKCASGGSVKLELSLNGEILDHNQDRKLLSEIPIRDKSVLNGKVCHPGLTGQSSNDSSSDSSMESPPPALLPECSLPGIILSWGSWQINFILDLEQKACEKNNHALAYAAHELIQLLPPHRNTLDKLSAALLNEDFSVLVQLMLDNPPEDPAELLPYLLTTRNTFDKSTSPQSDISVILRQLIFDSTPPVSAYHIQVLYSMIMPSIDPLSEKYRFTQLAFIRHVPLFLDAISDPNFLKSAPLYILRNGMLHLLKIIKLTLTTLGHFLVIAMPDSQLINNDLNQRINIKQMEMLKEALHSLPNQKYEPMLAVALAEKLVDQFAQSSSGELGFMPFLSKCLPTVNTIKATASHALLFATSHAEEGRVLSGKTLLNNEDVLLVREALEVITLCVALSGCKITSLLTETWWQDMMVQLIIVCPNPQIRVCCAEQLLAMCSWEDGVGAAPALSFLLTHINDFVKNHTSHAHQYFQLLCRLIATAGPQTAKPLLAGEVLWLKDIQRTIIDGFQIDDTLLEGHLSITKEIFLLSSSEVKYEYGSNPEKEHKLIKTLVCEFLWPCSWAQLLLRQNKNDTNNSSTDSRIMPTAICSTPGTIAAACELLVALCYRCVSNMALLTSLLTDMFYSDSSCTLSEWDYLPAVGPRAPSGLVGLKNAGATCYMNSVLQQLYMVPAIRDFLLKVQGAVTNLNEDFSGEEKNDSPIEDITNYNVEILKQVQAIFAHLHYSKLQYYVPRGLWTRFKLQGEPVNPREQQDAVEFFMSLVESIDEALKTLGQEQLMANTLGGSFSDQKICKECPHRYCKEEPFSVLSLDIRNMSRLQESLEAYVRGELLEGADAYQCDKCNKKVVTVKRVCLNKLPPVLGIQLKRFEYDFDRVCPIKFNDYFEFPRELDVEPYTVWGLAKAEGDSSLLDGSMTDNCAPNTKYNLTGIVVHSGQASGGHYYSFILHRDNAGNSRWLRFDDGDVSECGMQDDEEMKAQCFGGDYMGEVIDQMNKRVSYRRQKRWWNAYMLFYTREDCVKEYNLDKYLKTSLVKDTVIPKPIWDCVRKGNISFSHHQSQLSVEYFNFIKKLCCMKLCGPITANTAQWDSEQEELSMLCVQLATKFLFSVGYRTKKNLRGSTNDWFEILCQHLRCSSNIRSWFALNAIFQHPQRMSEYLLMCPSAEVRMTFMKLVVFLAHFSIQDSPVAGVDSCGKSSLSDQLLAAVVSMLNSREATEYARHLSLLFSLFLSYAALGLHEKHQLLKLNVVYHMISISTDEVTQASVKYQFMETVKLHQVVSLLVRCCDVSSRCQSSNTSGNAVVLPNPFAEPPLTPNMTNRPALPLQCAEALYNKTSYIKKLIEEYNSCEEIMKLVHFLAWENPLWSRAALSELLWQISYTYSHDLRHHMDLLLSLLLLEDSWQTHRIHNAVKGDEKDGLLDNIIRARGHYQKRAYQCIKLLVTLFSRSQVALQLLHENRDIRRRWTAAVAWLHDELDRQRFGPRQYNYNTWSPPGTSNDVSSGGYFLERSNSARKTLERAYMLCPEDEDEEASCSDKESESGGEDKPSCSNDEDTPNTVVTDNNSSSCSSIVNTKDNNVLDKTINTVDTLSLEELDKDGTS